MAKLFDILSNLTGKSKQQIKGNAKELQLDILARLVSTLTLTNAKVLRNIYIPYGKGKTTEIDMLLLANGNIYVFEVKNYTCTIVGNQSDKYWKAIYTPQKTYELYNPIMQNEGHISTLNSYLKLPKNSLKSVVVFSEDANTKQVKYTRTSNLCVLNMNTVVAYLIKQKTSKKHFTDNQLKDIYSKLKPLTKVSKDVKQQHIKDVQSKK
jgi:hypothetical protein